MQLTIKGPNEDFAQTGDVDVYGNLTVLNRNSNRTKISGKGDGSVGGFFNDRVRRQLDFRISDN